MDMLTVELNTPLDIGDKVTIKNRFMKSAMSEAMGTKAHAPSSKLPSLYRLWAEGGVGLSVTGNVMIDHRALGEPGNVVVEDDRHLNALKAWAKAGTAGDTHLWVQLNHPGKQIPKFLCREPVAPSAIPLGGGLEYAFNTPRALRDDEIWDIIHRFATSAAVARKAGFTGVQIHGAHGYLVSQFLSPKHNQRSDPWGGTPEKRMAFVIEVYRAVRKAVGDHYPVAIKLNSADFQRGGFTEDESMAVVKALAEEGLDLLEISGGTYESPTMTGYNVKKSTLEREAYFLDYAAHIRSITDIPLAVTGGFRTRDGMLNALRSNATDMVGLARPLAVYPDLPNDIMSGRKQDAGIKRLSTGSRLLDKIAMLDVTWYEYQLALMASGKPSQPDLNPLFFAVRHLIKLGRSAFRKKRA